jgi:hypothetical protein
VTEEDRREGTEETKDNARDESEEATKHGDRERAVPKRLTRRVKEQPEASRRTFRTNSRKRKKTTSFQNTNR